MSRPLRRPPFVIVAAGLSLALALALGGPATSQSPPPQTRPQPPRIAPAEAAQTVATIVEDLSEARQLLPRVSDRALRDRLERLLSGAELNARTLRDRLDLAARAQARPAEPAPLSAEPFARFLEGLKKNAFDNAKADFVENFTRGQRLTCAQAKTILKTFSFDEERARAAIALYPKLVDPALFHEVLDTFTFDSGRAQVRKALGLK